MDVPAILTLDGRRFPNCRITDFSAGGLYLDGANTDWRLANWKRRQLVDRTARVDVPLGQGSQQQISVKVQIVHIADQGLGVSFLDGEMPLREYLGGVVQRNRRRIASSVSGPGNPRYRTRLFTLIRGQALTFLRERLAVFFSECRERLLAATDRSTDLSPAELFHSLSILDNHQARIDAAISSNLEAKFATLQAKGRQAKEELDGSGHQELGLLDKGTFEEWLTIVSFGRSVEAGVLHHLNRLEQMLTGLAMRPVTREDNPVAPASLLSALSDALQELDIGFPMRRLVYPVFIATVLKQIDRLYDQLNASLASANVQSQPTDSQLHSTSPVVAAKPARPQHHRSLLKTLAAMSSLRETPSQPAGEGPRQMDGVQTADHSQITEALASLSPGNRQSLLRRLEQALRTGSGGGETRPIELDSDTRQTINTTQRLLAVAGQDNRIGGQLDPLFKWLELPVVEEVIATPNLFDDPDHPVRRLLESIDHLALHIDPETPDPELKTTLEGLMQPLGTDPATSNRDLILHAQQVIDRLVNRRRDAFERNRGLVVKCQRQRDRFENTRRLITNQLSEKLEGRSIAVAVDRLLRLGWPGLLIHSAVSHGDSSPQTRHYLEVVDTLLEAFEKNSSMKPMPMGQLSELRGILKQGFVEYPVHAQKAQGLIQELDRALSQGGEALRRLAHDRITADADYLRQRLPGQVETETESIGKSAISETTAEYILPRLNEGDWIIQRRGHGQARLLNLAWRNQLGSRYLFVDGRGNPALDCDEQVLAKAFEEAEYSLLEDHEIPLVERAAQHLLEGNFEQIKQDSHIDALTGLMNRKAFSLRVDSLLKSSTDEHRETVLILLDIDRFSTINDLCGYAGGDRLLKLVTRILMSCHGNDATIARMGDDEFGILMMNSTIENGFQIAETQRRAIMDLEFSWEGQSVPVSVSTGIVAIGSTTNTAATLLKAASSACTLAKQAGRNCSRVYQWSNQEVQEQLRLVQSIPVIEKALQRNRIDLHAQLITPLFSGEAQDHYEVLLRILDDNDQPGSPVEFVAAAERFDRMRSVDRWVLNAFFGWIKKHPDNGRGANYSINISGQSLLNDQFRAFLKQHLNSGVISPARLGFEITETALVTQMHRVTPFIEEIRQQGCLFLLDDFGSGYASYSYLKELPVDLVKIDGVFVKDMVTESSSFAMVNSITEVAHHMGKKVVAEYVENLETLQSLRSLGVDFGQGYAIGRPIPLKHTLPTILESPLPRAAGRPVETSLPCTTE